MTDHRVAIVGTGPSPEGETGHSIAYRHGGAYRGLDDCMLVACCDLVRENAMQFADAFDLGERAVYEDYERLLAETDPDVVSVCTSPRAHAPLVVGCAETGVPAAIHCEKPMATTWGDCRRMADACRRADIQLTFTHQRRFVAPWRRARRLLDDGAIGDLERVELLAPNFYDWGVHVVDLAHMFNGDRAPEWVMGQVEYTEENRQYGVHNENSMVATWAYDNGVHGLAATGAASAMVGEGVAGHRLRGTEGTIEIGCGNDAFLRIRRDGQWTPLDCDEEGLIAAHLDWYDPDEYHNPYFDRAIANVIDALNGGNESPLGARNALNAMETIFAGYESARRRDRIDLPLSITDNPLEAMVEDGRLSPARSSEE